MLLTKQNNKVAGALNQYGGNFASFLNISETNLLPLLPYPSLSLDLIKDFIPFIHRLLKYGYPAIAKEWAIQGRLPLSLLQDPTIPYNKFKKAYRDAKLLYEYKVKVLAQCSCQKCLNFRSKKKWYDPESNFSEDTYTPCFRFRGNLLKFN